MKKSIAFLLALVLSLTLLCGCGNAPADKTEAPADKTEAPAEAETPAEAEAPADKTEAEAPADKTETPAPVSVETLRIAFSPYADSDAILTAAEPLEALLKAKLLEKGYDVQNIELSVGTSYTAVGEALSAGSADLGFLSGPTYVLFSEDCDVLLTALRYAINKDSEDPADWNDGTLEQNTEETSTYYRCIILAGPSEKGRALAEKLQSGQALTWEDLDNATWSVLNPSSASGYIYPCLWLLDTYGHGINELSHVVQADSHSTSVARLASGQVDVMVSFGHIRLKNAAKWQSDFGGTAPMEEQTWVIGVTQGIYNDMIAYSKSSELMADEAFRTALGECFIELAQTEEGQAVFSVFSQIGYTWGKDSDYDGERAAQALLRELGE
ncbi:MAG: PhnD/SsuA/transferrin family substrate-binding protein [Oscillospiraceae bacterium]|nr:PhnD/SsuA/transferrin family substrate-binding protein [Oscillospiraceae bacterium]